MFANDRLAVSVPEAAAMIGVSKTKMYEIIRREDVDFAFMLGGRRLISCTKLEAWIDKQAENPKEEFVSSLSDGNHRRQT